MSGGSYEYVYRLLHMQELESVAQAGYQLRRMADDMAAAGYPEAAAPLTAILGRLLALEAWAVGLSNSGVPELCKSFEWWQSGDSTEDGFRVDLAKYLEATP